MIEREFATICTIGDKPTRAQPDGYFYVTVPVYAAYYENNLKGQCLAGNQGNESHCFKFSSNGLQCTECNTGYTLIT